MHGEGRAAPPGVLGIHAAGGGFHVKAASLDLSRPYFAAKLNANFPSNPERFGLPTIQGVVAVCDAANGALLALMDSIELTILRTGAATAVAAKHLARPGAAVVTIAGCGNQGRVSLRAIARVRPIARALLCDVDAARAARLADELSAELDGRVEVVTALPDATRQSGIVVTCTPSCQPLLGPDDVRAGTFIAAVGADNPEKHEIAVDLMARAVIIADIVAQCAEIGDLHHAIAAGVLGPEAVRAELGQVLAAVRPGRLTDEEIVVFDSTGTALQDVAAAALVYERAVASGRGSTVALA
jgi:ornithine cyclodeaminase/alanine dehydrogenase-like protein (mu-crystallin family)